MGDLELPPKSGRLFKNRSEGILAELWSPVQDARIRTEGRLSYDSDLEEGIKWGVDIDF